MTPLAGAFATVFAINLMPAFMPPTWSVLAFFLITFDLPLLPLAIGGAVAASFGRLTLAIASRRWGIHLVPRDRRGSLAALGERLTERAAWSPAAAMLLYSFGPIPSNQLFVAAGLTGLPLAPIVGAFLVGRLLSYTFWVHTATIAAARLEDIFSAYWSDAAVMVVQILLVASVAILVMIDWSRLVPPRASPTRSPPLPAARPRM